MSQYGRAILLVAFAAVVWMPALAERADRQQPINIEADRVSVDDRNRVLTFEGKVTLTQGTLTIRAERIVVTQSDDGFQKGVATGAPASLRQKREGGDEYVSGEAARIEYDSRSELARFFGRAIVRSGQDEVRGEYIEYNALTEAYTVTGRAAGTPASAPGAQDQRVRAVIRPKSAPQPAPGSASGSPAEPRLSTNPANQ